MIKEFAFVVYVVSAMNRARRFAVIDNPDGNELELHPRKSGSPSVFTSHRC